MMGFVEHSVTSSQQVGIGRTKEYVLFCVMEELRISDRFALSAYLCC